MRLNQKDLALMEMAYSLAEKGRGRTSPNPCVGAVVVKNGQIVGWGYHQAAGQPHAEVIAMERAGHQTKGATLYLTMEPCIHQGRTPPCIDRLLNSGLKRVVISVYDPNPLVFKKGVARLRAAGIQVVTGLLKELNQQLNEAYIKYISCGLPFVTLKVALSLDGKLATVSGESKWISSEESRFFAQNLRAEYDAVLVGINTVLKDNPRLTIRLESPTKKRWHRVVLDSRLRFPIEARMLKKPENGQVLIFSGQEISGRKIKQLKEKGVKVVQVPSANGQVDLKAVLEELGGQQISSVLVEGGAGILTSFLRSKLADKVFFFLSPKLIGGEKALTPFEGPGVDSMAKALKLKRVRHFQINKDIIIEGYF